MALGTPNLLATATPVTIAQIISPSFTPTANVLLLVVDTNLGTTAANTGYTCTDSLGTPLTYTLIGEIGGGATTGGVRAWWAQVGASPVSMTVTTNSPGGVPTHHRQYVYEVSGHDTVTPIVGAVTGSGTTATTPQTPVGATPATVDQKHGWVVARNINSAITIATSYTQIAEAHNVSPSATTLGQYRGSDTSTTFDPSAMSVAWNGEVAWIVQAAAAVVPAPFILARARPGLTWRRRFWNPQRRLPVAPASNTYSADATAPLTFTATADSTRTTLGQADAPLVFGATAAVSNTMLPQASAPLTFGATAAAARTTLGQADAPLSFTATAAAGRTTLGQADAPLSFNATAAATVTHAGISADVDAPLTFTGTAAASRTTLGQADAPLSFGATADSARTTLGQTSTVVTFGSTAAATRTTLGQTVTALSFIATADTTRTTLGQASASFSLLATSAASRTTLGQTTTALTLGLTAAASRLTLGQASQAFTVTFTAAATVTTAGTVTPGDLNIVAGTGPQLAPYPGAGPSLSPAGATGAGINVAAGTAGGISLV